MDSDQALTELPVAYATALRLQAVGAEQSVIADALGIDLSGVGPLLALAEAKLSHLLGAGAPMLVDGGARAHGHHG